MGDSTLLFGTSPTTATFNLHTTDLYSPSPYLSGHESDSGVICRSSHLSRRIQTYPPQTSTYGYNHTNPLHIFMASALKNRSVSDSHHLHRIDTLTPPPSATATSFPDSGVGTADSAVDLAAVRRQLQSMALQMPTLVCTPTRAPPPPHIGDTAGCSTVVTLAPVPKRAVSYDIKAKDEVMLHKSYEQRKKSHDVPLESTPVAITAEQAAMDARPRLVRFADDVGRPLEEVRVMQEPSDCPPKLDPAILRSILGDDAAAHAAEATWQLGFAQPAGDYIKFRNTLETQNVALENVVLRNAECRMAGTVRVKNAAFEKTVFIRYTDNNWLSYYDRPCVYKSNRLGDPSFDTFTFNVDIPADDAQHEHISFCVCFKAGVGAEQREHWDSNGGVNYSIMSAERRARIDTHLLTAAAHDKGKHVVDRPTDAPRTSDAWTLNMGTHWGNFSAWKNLTNDSPYY